MKQYSILLTVALWYYLGRLFGHIQVTHRTRFPKNPQGLIVCSNHPSLYETFMLYGLFAPHFLLKGVRRAPYSTPDKKNFSGGLIGLAKDFFILVQRGDSKEDRQARVSAFRQMVRALHSGCNIILFPEGGRTGKASTHLTLEGHKIGPFEDGIGALVAVTGAPVLLVWVEGGEDVLPIGSRFPNFRKRLTLHIGECIQYPNERDKKVITRDLEKRMLALAAASCKK